MPTKEEKGKPLKEGFMKKGGVNVAPPPQSRPEPPKPEERGINLCQTN